MNMRNNLDKSNIENEDSFNIKNEISYYLFFWPWFLLTIVMALAGSFTYLRYTPNIYSSSAQIQITKSDATSSFLTTEVTSLFGTRVNVENDISVITSQHILSKVVKRLGLQTSITEVGNLKSSLLFDNELPFKIKLKNLDRVQQWNMSFTNEKATLSNESSSFIINKNSSLENDYFSIQVADLSNIIQKKSS